MKLILLGPPGSGKGTVSERLVKDLKLEHISAGELLRDLISKETIIGKELKRYIEKGELVPNNFVAEIMMLMVEQKENFIYDGFPRSLDQADYISKIKIDKVIYLELSEKEVIERLAGRRLCPQCGTGYHLKYMPPKISGKCDKCKANLILRPDDVPAAIKERYKIFLKETKPVISYYKKKKILLTINASNKPEKVYTDVKSKLKN